MKTYRIEVGSEYCPVLSQNYKLDKESFKQWLKDPERRYHEISSCSLDDYSGYLHYTYFEFEPIVNVIDESNNEVEYSNIKVTSNKPEINHIPDSDIMVFTFDIWQGQYFCFDILVEGEFDPNKMTINLDMMDGPTSIIYDDVEWVDYDYYCHKCITEYEFLIYGERFEIDYCDNNKASTIRKMLYALDAPERLIREAKAELKRQKEEAKAELKRQKENEILQVRTVLTNNGKLEGFDSPTSIAMAQYLS